jgi:hypothetical protein
MFVYICIYFLGDFRLLNSHFYVQSSTCSCHAGICLCDVVLSYAYCYLLRKTMSTGLFVLKMGHIVIQHLIMCRGAEAQAMKNEELQTEVSCSLRPFGYLLILVALPTTGAN